MYMQTPLKHLRSCFGTLFVVCSHQVASEVGSYWGSCTAKFSQDNTWSQTTRAKGHNSERCSPFSRGPLQRAQCSWCGHPLFWRLSAVRILSCSRIHAWILHLFFAFAFQMRSCWNFRCEPLNFTLYAEWVEYTPLAIHFQVMESETSGYSWTLWILIHRPTNSWSSNANVILIRSDLIQLPLLSSWWTDLFLRRASMSRCGARYLGASLSSQLWCQKHALLPLPIVTVVEALKRRRSVSLHGTSVPTQGFGSSPHSC
jgi:hypothetical protein